MSKTTGDHGEDHPGPIERFMSGAVGKNVSYGAEAVVQLVPMAGGALGVVIGMARDGVAQREFERIVTGINRSLTRMTEYIESLDGAVAHLGEAFYAGSHRVVGASLETPDPDKRKRMREALASGVLRGWDDETQYFLRLTCKHEVLEATVLGHVARLMDDGSSSIQNGVASVWGALRPEQQQTIPESHVRGVLTAMEADGLVVVLPPPPMVPKDRTLQFTPDPQAVAVTPLGTRYLDFLREGEERAESD